MEHKLYNEAGPLLITLQLKMNFSNCQKKTKQNKQKSKSKQ